MTGAEFTRLARSLRCARTANTVYVLMAVALVRGLKYDEARTERHVQGQRLDITVRHGIVFG